MVDDLDATRQLPPFTEISALAGQNSPDIRAAQATVQQQNYGDPVGARGPAAFAFLRLFLRHEFERVRLAHARRIYESRLRGAGAVDHPAVDLGRRQESNQAGRVAPAAGQERPFVHAAPASLQSQFVLPGSRGRHVRRSPRCASRSISPPRASSLRCCATRPARSPCSKWWMRRPPWCRRAMPTTTAWSATAWRWPICRHSRGRFSVPDFQRAATAIYPAESRLAGLPAPQLRSSLVLTAACHKEEKKEEAEAPAPVQVTAVTQDTIRRIVSGDGVLYPKDQASVSPKLAAPVSKFYVNRGDHVKAGQLLATLENRDLIAAANEAKGALAAGRIQPAQHAGRDRSRSHGQGADRCGRRAPGHATPPRKCWTAASNCSSKTPWRAARWTKPRLLMCRRTANFRSAEEHLRALQSVSQGRTDQGRRGAGGVGEGAPAIARGAGGLFADPQPHRRRDLRPSACTPENWPIRARRCSP